MRTRHSNNMESVSSVQMCKVNTLDCPGCCSTRVWCPANPGFSVYDCVSVLFLFPHCPVSSALKLCCKSWQLHKMAWRQTQHLGNDGTPLTSVLVTKTAVHKQGLASTSCSKETHVHWHKPMSCTIWGAAMCSRCNEDNPCVRQGAIIFSFLMNKRLENATSHIGRASPADNLQLWVMPGVEVGSLPLLMFVCLQAAWEVQFKWAETLRKGPGKGQCF